MGNDLLGVLEAGFDLGRWDVSFGQALALVHADAPGVPEDAGAFERGSRDVGSDEARLRLSPRKPYPMM